MNYSWLNDVKVKNVGQLKPHCFYSFDPAISLSLNGLWQTKNLSEAKSPFSDDIQKIEWHHAEVPYKIDIKPSTKVDIPLDSETRIETGQHQLKRENTIYKKKFDIESKGNRKLFYLSFEYVGGQSYFWLNGEFLGYNESNSNEIEFDVTNAVLLGENELIVQVFQDQSTYQRNPYLAISGDILLYSLPEKHIRNYHISTFWNDIYGAAFELSVDLIGDANVEVTIYENDQPILIKDCLDTLSVKNLYLEPWTFENPKLYFLELCVIDKDGIVQQTVTQNIGFRSIEIVDGLLYFNGKYLTIKGVNRSEHCGEKLDLIDEETMLMDIRMLKAANINTIINFEHPHRRKWYQLCDKYGILVIDHVQNELLDKSPSEEANASFSDQHLLGVKSMFHRGKNHTCIIAWHLGDENNVKLDSSYQWLKSNEHARLVLLSQESAKGISDVYCPSFLTKAQLSNYVDSHPAKPLILSKIDHAYGNSLGGLKDYWEKINSNDYLQGGLLDGFVDGGIRNKEGIWDYLSPEEVKGLLLPDRTPHPTYFELKKIFQEISFRIDQEEQLIVFRNNNLFEPIIGVIEIRIWEAKQQLFFQRRNFELPAQASELITFNLDNNEFAASVFLDVTCFINNGEVAGEEQFILHQKVAEIPSSKKALVFPFVISPNLVKLPAQMDASRVISKKEQYSPVLTEEYIDKGTLCIKLKCETDCIFPRFGIKIKLPKIYSQVGYLGRGPHENYLDRKSSALWGQYYTTPEKMIPSYIIPQESGYRSENEELVITDLHGNGFKFTSILPFGFNYAPYSYEPGSVLPNNKEDLIESDHYVLSIDSYMCGIGGILSQEDESQSPFQMVDKQYEFTLFISAV